MALVESNAAWHDTPYLDRIWKAKQLPRAVRTALLELHREGVLVWNELSLEALQSLSSSELDEAQGLRLLDSFSTLVKAAHALMQQAQQAGARSSDWKNSILLELLHEQVMICTLREAACASTTEWRPV
jgi:hypothetical protein